MTNDNRGELPLTTEPSIILTTDINSKRWLNVIRRMQSVAKTGGHAAVTITVFVDKEGTPVQWLNPIVRKFEPKDDVNSFQRIMSEILGDSNG